MADVTVIRAELIGSRKCTALGITVEAYAPVLEMCRELVGRGHNPARPLHAYRDDVLCLTVSSIGWGAQYTVKDRICHISQTKFVRSKAALTQIIIASPSPQVTTRAGGGQEAQTIIRPDGVPHAVTMEAFAQAFATLGYVPCENGLLKSGCDKIAIYGKDRGDGVFVPTHAARQLPDGRWASKLGQCEDVEHATIDAVNGPIYGAVVRFMARLKGYA